MRFGKRIIISPQFTDIYRISRETSAYTPVFAQHMDDGIGKFTGSVSPLALKEAGAVGHPPQPLRAEAHDGGDREEGEGREGTRPDEPLLRRQHKESLKIEAFDPEMIAYEPPELVGTGISVSTARPSQITDFVKVATPSVRRLVGAGISNAGDVKKALELGADGWGVSSAFTKAKTPEVVLTELVEASRMPASPK